MALASQQAEIDAGQEPAAVGEGSQRPVSSARQEYSSLAPAQLGGGVLSLESHPARRLLKSGKEPGGFAEYRPFVLKRHPSAPEQRYKDAFDKRFIYFQREWPSSPASGRTARPT